MIRTRAGEPEWPTGAERDFLIEENAIVRLSTDFEKADLIGQAAAEFARIGPCSGSDDPRRSIAAPGRIKHKCRGRLIE